MDTEEQNFEERKLRSEELRFEYQMAQDMLKHYDTLNWQIGSILIAGVIVLTGFVLSKDIIDFMGKEPKIGIILVFAIPLLSFFVLFLWYLWYKRHRDLYNFRNEVFHRIEFDLKMFHYLKVAQANIELEDRDKAELAKTRKAVYGNFVPFKEYENEKLEGISGFNLVKIILAGIPSIQFITLLLVLLASKKYFG